MHEALGILLILWVRLYSRMHGILAVITSSRPHKLADVSVWSKVVGRDATQTHATYDCGPQPPLDSTRPQVLSLDIEELSSFDGLRCGNHLV